jgi:hypothetical protein
MRRREFMTLVGGAVVAVPVAARAQQRAMPVIGFLNSASADGYTVMADAFKQGLKETGYIDGQNVAIEYRWANNAYDRLPGLAADLVKRQVAVIVANSPSIAPTMAATTTIPITFFERRRSCAAWLRDQSCETRRKRHRGDDNFRRTGSEAARTFARPSPASKNRRGTD